MKLKRMGNAIKSKNCSYVGCTYPIFSNGYCQLHQYARTDSKWLKKLADKAASAAVKQAAKRPAKTLAKKPVNYNFKPLAKNSKARGVINRIYEKRGRVFRAEKKVCEVCPILRAAGIDTPLCSGNADAVHHTRGKATIELLLNELFWMASCFWANGIWIEENSEQAFELRLKVPDYSCKLSRFKQ